MAQVSIHEAEAQLPRLIAEALDGADVVIARDNVPMVRLVPVAPVGQRRFGALKGRLTLDARFHDPLPEEELAAWEPS